MSEKRSFLNEEYTQLITEIRNHLWAACTKYNNEIPRELKDLLGNYKFPSIGDVYDIYEDMVHALDHMDKLLSKINISPESINSDEINLGIEENIGQENKLWLVTFSLDTGATWHEHKAVIKGPNEDFVKRRLLDINNSLGGESWIPNVDEIKIKCINKDDFICFTTIPQSEFKNNDGGKNNEKK